MKLYKDLSLSEYYTEEQLRKELFNQLIIDLGENKNEFYDGHYGLEYQCNTIRDIKTINIDYVYNELLNYGWELEEIDTNKYQEEIFYLGLQLVDNSKYLLIDNFYSTIKNIILIDFISKGYNDINEGLLECVNRYINDNKEFIDKALKDEWCYDE